MLLWPLDPPHPEVERDGLIIESKEMVFSFELR